MNTKQEKRSYNMSKRAESAAETERAIFDAAAELWRENAFGDITLDMVAERAGVSVRTVIRRHGSKEGLFEAAILTSASNVQTQRHKATPGDLNSTIDYLLYDYEVYGDAMARTLAVEDQIAAARKVIIAGRNVHKKWCKTVFAPFLSKAGSKDYEPLLNAFIAATDLYLWKLLRRDLGHDLETTKKSLMLLLEGLVK